MLQAKSLYDNKTELVDKKKDPTAALGQQVVKLELQNMELKQMNSDMGKIIIGMDLRLMRGGL